LVAHSDGSNLFIGGEKVSLDELAALPTRDSNLTRARVAVLISCFAGNVKNAPETFSERVGRILRGRKNTQSLAEILTNKRFFDQVLAPEGEITTEQGVTYVEETIKQLRKSLGASIDGLVRIAERFFPQLEVQG
jgi:hypothetical protein